MIGAREREKGVHKGHQGGLPEQVPREQENGTGADVDDLAAKPLQMTGAQSSRGFFSQCQACGSRQHFETVHRMWRKHLTQCRQYPTSLNGPAMRPSMVLLLNRTRAQFALFGPSNHPSALQNVANPSLAAKGGRLHS